LESSGFSPLCENMDGFCNDLLSKSDVFKELTIAQDHQKDAIILQECQTHNMCSLHLGPAKTSAAQDIRVSKGYGKRGYNFARISLITNSSTSSPFFTYQSQFKYRWRNKYLHSAVVSVAAGANKFQLDSQTSIVVNLPAEEDGVRGIMIADPCISDSWVTCVYGSLYDLLRSSTTLLNTFLKSDDFSFYGILGGSDLFLI
jgi:hypothetical protein